MFPPRIFTSFPSLSHSVLPYHLSHLFLSLLVSLLTFSPAHGFLFLTFFFSRHFPHLLVPFFHISSFLHHPSFIPVSSLSHFFTSHPLFYFILNTLFFLPLVPFMPAPPHSSHVNLQSRLLSLQRKTQRSPTHDNI